MQSFMCRAKIHRACVVRKDINYEGSISIAEELLSASTLRPYELVQVINITTGARFETYVIRGKKHSGVALNGGAARLGEIGDRLIILSYSLVDERQAQAFKPVVISLDEHNKIISNK